MRSRRLAIWILACSLMGLSGCHSFFGYRGWPFPEHERTTFHTPAMRIDTVQQISGKADGTDSTGQRELTDQLARQIQIEPDPLVRKAIIEATAEFRTPLAPQILAAGLSDEHQAVRIACCEALGHRAENSSVPELARALRNDKNLDVRLAAAEALGQIDSPEAMAALVIALDDRDPALQYVGVQSLKTISGKDFGGDVEKWRQLASGGNPPAAESETPSVADSVMDVFRR